MLLDATPRGAQVFTRSTVALIHPHLDLSLTISQQRILHRDMKGEF